MALSARSSEGNSFPPGTKAWDYGIALFQQGHYAEAMAVMQSVVAHNPGDLAQRQALRELQRQLPRTDTRAEPSPLLTEIWWEIQQAKRPQSVRLVEWDQIDLAIERGLTIDPWDADLHVELGHACLARGYRDVARFAFACALETAPERPDVQEQLRLLGET